MKKCIHEYRQNDGKIQCGRSHQPPVEVNIQSQDGFGWTNGVYLAMKAKLLQWQKEDASEVLNKTRQITINKSSYPVLFNALLETSLLIKD